MEDNKNIECGELEGQLLAKPGVASVSRAVSCGRRLYLLVFVTSGIVGGCVCWSHLAHAQRLLLGTAPIHQTHSLPLTYPTRPNEHSLYLSDVVTTRPSTESLRTGYSCIWAEFRYGSVVREWCLNPQNEDNVCDTFADIGDDWPLFFDMRTAFTFYAKDAQQSGYDFKLVLFPDDYCSGGFKYEFDQGLWTQSWQNIGPIKSMRPYIKQPDQIIRPGVGVKVVFFPDENMQPYDEFTCGDGGHNDWLDVGLQNPTNAQGGDWPNACASSDDRIFCLSPTNEHFQTRYGTRRGESTSAIVYLDGPRGWVDFAGYAGPGTVAYTFGAYPLGSIFFNLYWSNWNGGGDGTSGAYCGGTNGVNSETYYVCEDTFYKDYCVAIRMWEDGWPSNNDWDAPGWWQASASITELCTSGGMCLNAGTDVPRQQGKATIACGNRGLRNSKGVAYSSWPLKVTSLYTRIIPCSMD